MSRRQVPKKSSVVAHLEGLEPLTSDSSSSGTYEGDESGDDTNDNSNDIPVRFRGKTIYQIFDVPSTATEAEIQRAYRRQALRCHPDVSSAPTATAEFQYLCRCHEILTNTDSRAYYDRTGRVDFESTSSSSPSSATAYWHSVFNKVTIQGIDAYQRQYVGSETEKVDLRAAYLKHGGNLECIFESVPFASAAHADRLCALLNILCGAKISKMAIRDLKRELTQLEHQEAEEVAATTTPTTLTSATSSASPSVRQPRLLLTEQQPNDNPSSSLVCEVPDLATQLRRRQHERLKQTRGLFDLDYKRKSSTPGAMK